MYTLQSVTEILAKADKLSKSPLELIECIYDGRIPDIKPPVKRKIPTFVEAIRALRNMAVAGDGPGDIIKQLLELVDYEVHLKKHHDDWETRWENVGELISFASEFEYVPPTPARARKSERDSEVGDEDDWADALDDDEENPT